MDSVHAKQNVLTKLVSASHCPCQVRAGHNTRSRERHCCVSRLLFFCLT